MSKYVLLLLVSLVLLSSGCVSREEIDYYGDTILEKHYDCDNNVICYTRDSYVDYAMQCVQIEGNISYCEERSVTQNDREKTTF